MSPSEKKLLAVVSGLAGLFIVGLSLRALIFKPLAEIDKRTAVLRGKLDKAKAERRAFFQAEDRLKTLTLRTFSDTIDQTSARSGEILTQLILQSGLPEDEFTRLPVGPRKVKGAQEIGWSIQGDGTLTDVIDLVFMLEKSPYLHRVENLSLSPGDAPGLVRARFRYLTLVIDPAPEVTRTDLLSKYTLESPERQVFNQIVARDVLRPYIKRLPASAQLAGSKSGNSPPTPPPGPESFRVVSLSEWRGQPEIHVRDLIHDKTQRYKPGDSLAGGTVVSVDYRPMPMPGNESLRSDSRVIIKVGSDYFTIERGKTLADLRKLPREQWPPNFDSPK